MRTAKTRLTVEVEHIGRDGILALASARVWIAGVEIVVNGLEVRRGLDGRLAIDAPGVSHGGHVLPAVELPQELETAIGREIAALLK